MKLLKKAVTFAGLGIMLCIVVLASYLFYKGARTFTDIVEGPLSPGQHHTSLTDPLPGRQGFGAWFTQSASPSPAKSPQMSNEIDTRQKDQGRLDPQAEKKAKADAIMQNLEVTFTNGYSAEVQAAPGAMLNTLQLVVKNKSSEPIKGLRIIVSPSEYLELDHPNQYNTAARPAFKKLTTTGLPLLFVFNGQAQKESLLYPAESNYYPKNNGMTWMAAFVGLQDLILSRHIQPGQDIKLNSYLIINGVKEPGASILIHVMHPN